MKKKTNSKLNLTLFHRKTIEELTLYNLDYLKKIQNVIILIFVIYHSYKKSYIL